MHKLTHDEIRLTLPTAAAYAGVARSAATGLAARLGFSRHELDELASAVDEVWRLVCLADAHRTLTLVFAVEPDGLSIDASSTAALTSNASSTSRLARMLDEFEVADSGTRLHLRKQHHDPM